MKLRNPWGKGEFTKGMWDDDGPGWAKHPEVKAALNPSATDDGIFWISREECWRYLDGFSVCAMDMSKFGK